jgi:hypothetical protein
MRNYDQKCAVQADFGGFGKIFSLDLFTLCVYLRALLKIP